MPSSNYCILQEKNSHVTQPVKIDVHLALLCFPKLSSFADMRWVFQRRAAGQHHPKRLPLSVLADVEQLTTIIQARRPGRAVVETMLDIFFWNQRMICYEFKLVIFYFFILRHTSFSEKPLRPGLKLHSYKAGLLSFCLAFQFYTRLFSSQIQRDKRVLRSEEGGSAGRRH